MSCDDVPLTMQREAAEEEEKEKDEGVVVDEEAVQYNMELTQRIQSTVCKGVLFVHVYIYNVWTCVHVYVTDRFATAGLI